LTSELSRPWHVAGKGKGDGEAGEVEAGSEDGREKEAGEDEVNPHGVADGVEVRALVAFDIDGLDEQFEGAAAGAAQVGENGHLVLVALAFQDEELGQQSVWEGAQAGLRVGQARARDEGEDGAGERVAEAAAQGDVGDEAAGAEDSAVVGCEQRLRYAEDVRRGVLTVGVGGDEAGHVGKGVEAVVDARFEGTAFAEVDGVAEDVDARELLGGCEDGSAGRGAAVVDEDDGSEAG